MRLLLGCNPKIISEFTTPLSEGIRGETESDASTIIVESPLMDGCNALRHASYTVTQDEHGKEDAVGQEEEISSQLRFIVPAVYTS